MGGRSLFEQSFANLSRIPRKSWLVALFACALSASGDVAYWASGSELSWDWLVPFLARAAVWFAAVYVSALGILRWRTSFRGYLLFAATSVVALLPVALTITFGIVSKPYVSEAGRIWTLIAGVVASFILTSLLAGWPVAQSLSSQVVSPARILRATRGHRGSLVFVGFTAAAIGRSDLIPEMSKANNVAEASLISLAHGLLNLFVLGVTAAIAATAWQFAVRADEGLAPELNE